MMVAGTAASVGLALVNDRRLTPVLVEAIPQAMPVPVPAFGGQAGDSPAARDLLGRRLGIATLIGVAVLLLAAGIPALTTLASSLRTTSSVPQVYGPSAELRSASGVGGNWERSYASAAPSAGQLGAALLAGMDEQRKWDVMKAMHILADQQAAAAAAEANAIPYDPSSSWQGGAAAHGLGVSSGISPGTVIRARITIYGCTGPGGGFCNHLASGGSPFAGAVACSSNLPFGTKLTIDGDPTGRVYECLDRGSLAPTWIDVYFDNTSDGIAWQSSLGSTMTDITIVN